MGKILAMRALLTPEQFHAISELLTSPEIPPITRERCLQRLPSLTAAKADTEFERLCNLVQGVSAKRAYRVVAEVFFVSLPPAP